MLEALEEHQNKKCLKCPYHWSDGMYKEYEKGMEFLHQVREMPSKILEEQEKRIKLYEKLKKLINKNTTAYKKR